MDEQHEITLIGGEDGDKALFTTHEDGELAGLTCSYCGRTIQAEASDFFDALCQVRRRLAFERLVPFCYGASLNVYPSRMARDMGQGLKAYRLTKGQAGRMNDLVGIFEAGPDVRPASVEAQEAFWREWLASLRR